MSMKNLFFIVGLFGVYCNVHAMQSRFLRHFAQAMGFAAMEVDLPDSTLSVSEEKLSLPTMKHDSKDEVTLEEKSAMLCRDHTVLSVVHNAADALKMSELPRVYKGSLEKNVRARALRSSIILHEDLIEECQAEKVDFKETILHELVHIKHRHIDNIDKINEAFLEYDALCNTYVEKLEKLDQRLQKTSDVGSVEEVICLLQEFLEKSRHVYSNAPKVVMNFVKFRMPDYPVSKSEDADFLNHEELEGHLLRDIEYLVDASKEFCFSKVIFVGLLKAILSQFVINKTYRDINEISVLFSNKVVMEFEADATALVSMDCYVCAEELKSGYVKKGIDRGYLDQEAASDIIEYLQEENCLCEKHREGV